MLHRPGRRLCAAATAREEWWVHCRVPPGMDRGSMAAALRRVAGMQLSHFVQMLFYMAVHPDGGHLVRWDADNRGLCVARSAHRMSAYLGQFFQSCAQMTFLRQLSYYNFYQTGKKGADFLVYAHAAFDVTGAELPTIVRGVQGRRSPALVRSPGK